MRLLLVEDNKDVAETVVAYLERQGYVVDVAPTLATARRAVSDESFDLVLLDRMLPDGDGLDLLEAAGRAFLPQRFLVLTALGEVDDRLRGLEGGATDYVIKPFEPRELLARIRNALRLPLAHATEERRFGPLRHDLRNGQFFIDEQPLVLRRGEALVLEALMARPGMLVQRESLERRVYGYDKFVNGNSLESQISRLRQHLARHTDRVRIQVVRGLGYQLQQD